MLDLAGPGNRYDYLLHSTVPRDEDWGIHYAHVSVDIPDGQSLPAHFVNLYERAKLDHEYLDHLQAANRLLADVEWQHRTSTLLSRPTIVQLSQTEMCNLLCTYCRPDKPKGLRTMPRDYCLQTLHHLLPTASEFLPFCWGEPLLSPDFIPMCELAFQYRTPISLITHLNHLNSELTEAFARYVTRALVSIDTVDADAFASVRRGGDLSKLESNLQAIQQAANTQNASLWLGVSAVLTRSNMHGIPALISWAENRGFRGICMRRVVIRESLPHFQNTEEIDLLSTEYLDVLATCKELTRKLGVVLNMPDSHRSTGKIPACRCLWDHVYISASGTINMCVYSHRQSMGRLPLVDDYWNMPEIVARRSGWTDDTRCDECCVLDVLERPEVPQVRGY